VTLFPIAVGLQQFLSQFQEALAVLGSLGLGGAWLLSGARPAGTLPG